MNFSASSTQIIELSPPRRSTFPPRLSSGSLSM
jgi:hypothetical protein